MAVTGTAGPVRVYRTGPGRRAAPGSGGSRSDVVGHRRDRVRDRAGHR